MDKQALEDRIAFLERALLIVGGLSLLNDGNEVVSRIFTITHDAISGCSHCQKNYDIVSADEEKWLKEHNIIDVQKHLAKFKQERDE